MCALVGIGRSADNGLCYNVQVVMPKTVNVPSTSYADNVQTERQKDSHKKLNGIQILNVDCVTDETLFSSAQNYENIFQWQIF